MANELFTDEVKQLIDSYMTELPAGVLVDVVEYVEKLNPHLAIRVYRDNFDALEGVDKERAVQVIDQMIKGVWRLGIPCFPEAEAHVPTV